jgi:hypothetical protein
MTATIIPFRQRTVEASTAAQGAGGFSQFHSASDYFDFSDLRPGASEALTGVSSPTWPESSVQRIGSGPFEDEWLALEMYDGEFPVDRESLLIYSIMTVILAAALGAVTGAWLA